MFCKNDSVKQKKQVLSVKYTEYYAPTDVIALSSLRLATDCIKISNIQQKYCIKKKKKQKTKTEKVIADKCKELSSE